MKVSRKTWPHAEKRRQGRKIILQPPISPHGLSMLPCTEHTAILIGLQQRISYTNDMHSVTEINEVATNSFVLRVLWGTTELNQIVSVRFYRCYLVELSVVVVWLRHRIDHVVPFKAARTLRGEGTHEQSQTHRSRQNALDARLLAAGIATDRRLTINVRAAIRPESHLLCCPAVAATAAGCCWNQLCVFIHCIRLSATLSAHTNSLDRIDHATCWLQGKNQEKRLDCWRFK